MNPLLYPNSGRGQKTNMERIHKLVKNDQKSKKSSTSAKSDMPNDWIYNDAVSQQVWEDLEKDDDRPRVTSIPDTNPFKKIDQSAARIRQAIATFELQDQESLMGLIDLIGDDSAVEELDQENILMEARVKLATMINDHVHLSEQQVEMLNQLRFWFKNLEKGKTNRDPDLVPNSETDIFDVQQLMAVLAAIVQGKEDNAEKAANLHEDIVSSLNKRVQDIQGALQQKEYQISQIHEGTTNKRAGRRSVGRRGISINMDSELSMSQRKVLELQNQIVNLRQALQQLTTPKLNENGDQSVVIPDMFSIEKELDFENKISVLSEEVRSLKQENHFLQTKMAKNRQNELVHEQKINILEKGKKNAELNYQALLKKNEQMKNMYEDQIIKLKLDQDTQPVLEGESVLEVTRRYEKKIEELNELHRQAIASFTSENESKYRNQLKDMQKAYASGDISKVSDELTQQFGAKMELLQARQQQALTNMKKDFQNQIAAISKNYEQIIKLRDETIQRIKSSVESEIHNAMIKVKLDMEEKNHELILEAQEKSTSEYAIMRSDLMRTIEDLKNKLARSMRENKSMRSLLESNPNTADFMDDLDLDFSEEEEEEDQRDDVLLKSLQSLKVREIEQKVHKKYMAMLERQKSVFTETQEWEIKQVKLFYSDLHEKLLSDFRRNTTTGIKDIYQAQTQTKVEDLLQTTIKNVAQCELESYKIKDAPTVPLPEVNKKIDDMKMNLIKLQNENDLWKYTLDNLGLDKDAAESIKKALQKHAEQIAQLTSEKEQLEKQLKQNKTVKIKTDQTVVMDPYVEKMLPPQAERYSTIESLTPLVMDQTNKVKMPRPASTNFTLYNSKPKRLVMKFFQIFHTIENNDKKANLKSALNNEGSANSGDKITCEECKTRFVLDSDNVRQKKLIANYVRCPECLSPYHVSYESPSEEEEESIQGDVQTSSKSKQNDSDLKSQIKKITKQSAELENNFLKRLKEMDGEFVKIKTSFLTNCIKIIENTKDYDEDDIQRKKDIVMEILNQIRDLNIPQTEEAKLGMLEIIENAKSVQYKEDMYDIVEDSLRYITSLTDQPLKYFKKKNTLAMTSRTNLPQLPNDDDEDSANESVPMSMKIIKKMNTNFKSIINDQQKLRTSYIQLIEYHNQMLSDIRRTMTDSIERSINNRSNDLQMIDNMKNQLLAEQEEAEKYRNTLLQEKEKYEELQSQLYSSVAQYEKMQIRSEIESKELEALKNNEDEGKKYIEDLTQIVLGLRDNIHNLQKENERSRLYAQSLENQVLFHQANKAMKTTREQTRPCIIFQTPVSNNQPPPIKVPTLMNFPKVASERPQTSERIKVKYQEKPSLARVYVPKSGKQVVPRTPRSENSEIIQEGGDSSIVMYVTPFLKEKTIPIKNEGPGLLITEPPKKEPLEIIGDNLNTKLVEANTQVFNDLNKRIRILEDQILAKNHDLENEQDKSHSAYQDIFKLKMDYQKINREVKKLSILNDNVKNGLSKAISMIDERDTKIHNMKQQIRQMNAKVAPIVSMIERKKSKEVKDRNVTLTNNENFFNFLKSFKDDKLLNQMAKNEQRSIIRWEEKRNKLISEEKERILSVLDAMCFITQPTKAEKPKTLVTVKSARSVKVTSKTMVPRMSKKRNA